MHDTRTQNIYKLREIGIDDVFDANTIFPHAHFTQSKVYAKIQIASGRTVKRFCVYKDDMVVAYFQYIAFPLFKSLQYAYIPYGPVVAENQDGLALFIKENIQILSYKEHLVFIRLDFDPVLTKKEINAFFRAPTSSYKGVVFQPRNEWVLSVQKSNEELLQGMHEKTRYSIRTAEKREITTEVVTGNLQVHFDTFYTLMGENAKRNGFYLHPKKYYQDYFNVLQGVPHASLVLAKYFDDILCVYVLVPYGNTVHYVFGASSDHEKNRMPTYAAHFTAMQHVRDSGYINYNFGGIEGKSDMSPGMRSLTAYKKKFGGEEIAHGEFYDVIVRPFWYWVYIIRKYIKNLLA